jgi:hypothetical protein
MNVITESSRQREIENGIHFPKKSSDDLRFFAPHSESQTIKMSIHSGQSIPVTKESTPTSLQGCRNLPPEQPEPARQALSQPSTLDQVLHVTWNLLHSAAP